MILLLAHYCITTYTILHMDNEVRLNSLCNPAVFRLSCLTKPELGDSLCIDKAQSIIYREKIQLIKLHPVLNVPSLALTTLN